ncbi:DUF3574 domain-containing protein [Acetobacter sp. AN02]|nr:DUF3574 domain-containing protein [Acetobacter sp. AN02]
MFGQTRPDGTPITTSGWQDFLSRSITPLFPDGLTVLPGQGQWRGRRDGKITSEPSHLVWIVTRDTPETARKISVIRESYKTRFSQQSVGLLAGYGCSSF